MCVWRCADVWEGITLFRGSVGVTVRNNEISNYLFDGIRCGADTGYVMDCHLNLIAYNFMTNPASYVDGTSDVNHAGIYFCTHWFNPGEAPLPTASAPSLVRSWQGPPPLPYPLPGLSLAGPATLSSASFLLHSWWGPQPSPPTGFSAPWGSSRNATHDRHVLPPWPGPAWVKGHSLPPCA